MKKNRKRLSFDRQVILLLQPSEQHHVRGGLLAAAGMDTASCPGHSCDCTTSC